MMYCYKVSIVKAALHECEGEWLQEPIDKKGKVYALDETLTAEERVSVLSDLIKDLIKAVEENAIE